MRDGFAVHGAEGALGGALGALLIKQTLSFGRRAPALPARNPAEIAVARIEALRGRPLSPEARGRALQAVRLAFGVGWGGALGVAVAALHVRRARGTLLAGAGMGALLWAVGYAGMPPERRAVARRGMAVALAGHVAGGLAASLPIVLIDGLRRRREPFWRRLLARFG